MMNFRILQQLIDSGKVDPSLQSKLDEKQKAQAEAGSPEEFQQYIKNRKDLSNPEAQDAVIEDVVSDQSAKRKQKFGSWADAISKVQEAGKVADEGVESARAYGRSIANETKDENAFAKVLERMKQRRGK